MPGQTSFRRDLDFQAVRFRPSLNGFGKESIAPLFIALISRRYVAVTVMRMRPNSGLFCGTWIALYALLSANKSVKR